MNETPCLYSGGAIGADAFWSKSFTDIGVPVVTFSFRGHYLDRSVTTLPETHSLIKILSPQELDSNRSEVEEVCRTLKRRPLSLQKPYVQNLLLRDAWQAKADLIYAVSELDPSTPSLGISGGTAYACELFARKHQDEGPLPIYLFDQSSPRQVWLQPTGKGDRFEWQAISEPPVPTKTFAAIGTRGLNQAGREAITTLAERLAMR